MFKLPGAVLAAIALAAPLTIAMPAEAAAPSGPKLVPFHGTAAGTFSFAIVPPNRVVSASGSGHATHLGRFDAAIDIVARLSPVVLPGCATLGNNEFDTTTFTAANGDTLTVAGAGTTCPTSSTTAVSLDELEVVGGTGRFEGASGTIVVRGAIDRSTFTFSVTYEGSVSTPGSAK